MMINREKAIGYSGKALVNAGFLLIAYAGYTTFGAGVGLTLLALFIILHGIDLQQRVGWINRD